MPEPVRDLAAQRSGDAVELHFTVPEETTDGLPLGKAPLYATVCRQDAPSAPCHALPLGNEDKDLAAASRSSGGRLVWKDLLPAPLTLGEPKLLQYRIEVRNAQGKSAGYSMASFVPGGATPPPVADLEVQGVRTGLLLQWTPVTDGGEVLLKREEARADGAKRPVPSHTAAHATKTSLGKHTRGGIASSNHRRASQAGTPTTVWLQADPGDASAAHTIDGTVQEGAAYRYTAARRVQAVVEGRHLVLESATSTPVEGVWHDVYPPATPQGLTAVRFSSPTETGTAGQGFAVDLVWQPVMDPRLTGYLVQRIRLQTQGDGSMETLTPEPIATPGFHDTTGRKDAAYRYEVRSVDAKGNKSPPATTVVQPGEQ